MNATELKRELQRAATAEEFCAFGVADIAADVRAEYLQKWLAEGRHGSMAWMTRPERGDPKALLPTAACVIVVALNYYQPAPNRTGKIATYALGDDYHKIIPKKLKVLEKILTTAGYAARASVDTAAVMEKPLTAATAVGWQGKNTMLVSPTHGQWIFLATILTDAPLPTDTPTPDRCGHCTRCIDCCPTHAITAPYQLDARACIAYLTIEHKGQIEEALMEKMGDHLYGCDDCLVACPWNRWAKQTSEVRLAARNFPSPTELLVMDEEAFAKTFAGSPIKRTGLAQMQRNACIVLGNGGKTSDLPALSIIAENPTTPDFLKNTARWAIGRISLRQTL